MLVGGDGRHERGRARGDRPSAIGRDLDYRLSGALGAALAARMFELEWVGRLPPMRAVRLTDAGRAGLAGQLGVALP